MPPVEECGHAGVDGEERRQAQVRDPMYAANPVGRVHECKRADGQRGVRVRVESGHERFERDIKLTIPAGVDSATRLQMSGQGNAGERGGMPGNLIVSIQVNPHEFFTREDSNIIYDLKINFAQAALGTELAIPTLYGDAQLKVPAGAQAGDVFTLRGKGIQHFRRSGKGDELVRLHIVTPEKLTKEQRRLFEELAESFEEKKKKKEAE